MAENTKMKMDPFAASQPVWLIDSDRIEIDKIQGALSPEVVHFDDFDTIVDAFSTRLQSNNENYGTLIVTRNIPTKFKTSWGAFVKAVNDLKSGVFKNRLFIFEINEENNGVHEFVDSNLYDNVNDFISGAHDVHIDSVTGSSDVSEEAAAIITQLKIEQSKNKSDLKYQKEQIEKLTEEKKNAIDQLDSVNQQINSYKEQARQGKITKEKAEKDIEENTMLIKAKQQRIDELEEETNRSKNQIVELKIKIEASNDSIKEQNANIVSLQQQIIDNERQIDEQNKQTEMVLNARSTAEEQRIVQERLNAQLDLNKKKEKENIELRQQISRINIRTDALEKENEGIRNGYRSINRIGYSNDFGVIETRRTKVMYFKVINDLPFHRFYIDELHKMVRQLIYENDSLQYSSNVKIVYFKVDYGSDKEIIGDYPLISNLGDINDNEDHYLMIPSPDINANIEDFESKEDILIFVDYISNNKYYINTQGVVDYYSIVNHNSQANDLNLRGKVISYDRDSLIDLKFDSHFVNLTDKNKQDQIQGNLYKILSESSVVGSSIGA